MLIFSRAFLVLGSWVCEGSTIKGRVLVFCEKVKLKLLTFSDQKLEKSWNLVVKDTKAWRFDTHGGCKPW